MAPEDFKEYIDKFELEVVEAGIRTLGAHKLVPVRNGRLFKSKFGAVMGKRVKSRTPLAVDYYGYLKKSFGFFDEVDKTVLLLEGRQIRMIEVPVVHFASIKIEIIAERAPYLVSQFPLFKRTVLSLRGFNRKPSGGLK